MCQHFFRTTGYLFVFLYYSQPLYFLAWQARAIFCTFASCRCVIRLAKVSSACPAFTSPCAAARFIHILGESVVLCYSMSLIIPIAEVILRLWQFLLSSQPIPLNGCCVVLLYSLFLSIQSAEVILRKRIALVGQLQGGFIVCKSCNGKD
jgi:hypothetical protein